VEVQQSSFPGPLLLLKTSFLLAFIGLVFEVVFACVLALWTFNNEVCRVLSSSVVCEHMHTYITHKSSWPCTSLSMWASAQICAQTHTHRRAWSCTSLPMWATARTHARAHTYTDTHMHMHTHSHPHAQEDVTMQLPANVGDYTDFYASKEHATNVGRIFRPNNPDLNPNWYVCVVVCLQLTRMSIHAQCKGQNISSTCMCTCMCVCACENILPEKHYREVHAGLISHCPQDCACIQCSILSCPSWECARIIWFVCIELS
jgi:hypothetical protein